MDLTYSKIVRWGLLHVPNNGRPAGVNLRFLHLGSYYLGASAIPTAHRASEASSLRLALALQRCRAVESRFLQ